MSAESPDRAEEREVEDDSPFWLLHAAELADLEVGEGREEAGRETDERGEGLAGRKFGLEHERDAEETQHDGCGACAAERLAVLYGEEDDDEGHVERARVVERHGGAERQPRDCVEPDRECERAEEAAHEMRTHERRPQREALRPYPECDDGGAEGRAVEDEFKRGEVGGAHACEGGHQGEE